MSSQQGYGFYFERTGRGRIQGPNDSSGEHFTGMDLAESLVRELIQNSVDAHREDHDGPVEVEFDLRWVPTNRLPGYEDLLNTIRQVVANSRKLQGGDAMQRVLHSLQERSVPVLRVGDYGTTGLMGDESDDDPLASPLSALTRGSGISSDESLRGGSFGIGSSVGFVGSRMRTVAYVTKAVDKPDERVFASMCRFTSHKDAQGDWRDGFGLYTLLDAEDPHYLRSQKPIGDFPQREELGTDLYLYDYIDGARDQFLHGIRKAVARNFMVAIHRGRLIVRGKGPKGSWVLDKENLPNLLTEDVEMRSSWLPFYKALTENDPIVDVLPTLGEVQLFVHVDSEMEKALHTQMMRSPLMRVDWYRPRFPVPYAAIFICENKQGDDILRGIEPPAHNKWPTTGPRSNGKAVREIRGFIRSTLDSVLPQQSGSQTTIEGLEEYVPLLDPSDNNGKSDYLGTTPRGELASDRESPVRLGSEDDYSVELSEEPVEFEFTTAASGISDPEGEQDGYRGDPSGGQTDTDSDSKRVETRARTGDGEAIISGRTIHLRSFQPSNRDHTVVVITGKQNTNGALSLSALDSGGNEVMPLPIEKAWIEENGVSSDVPFRGSTITELHIERGKKTRLGLVLAGRQKYRIGVRNG